MWVLHITNDCFRYSDVVEIENVAEECGMYVITGRNLEIVVDKRDFIFDYVRMRGAGWVGDFTITIDNVEEIC